MRAALKWGIGGVLGLGALFLFGSGEAIAQCCAPPPPCCAPPAPPPCCVPPTPPTPPSPPCCMVPGHSVNVPGVNVFVGANVVVNAQVNAQANVAAQSSALGQGRSTVFFGGGGFAGGLMPAPASVIPSLNVEGGREMKRVAYEATRSKTVKIVIQAFCLDDKEVPHPASQVFPERDVDLDYEGELYRCLAGTRMQWHYAEYLERVSFDGAKITTCAKGDALWRGRDGKLECRKQTTARDCNERSLLRRFGAGIKVVMYTMTETYTAYREEMSESSSFSSGSMQLNGGVGGIAY
jgi:hypothetical protein